ISSVMVMAATSSLPPCPLHDLAREVVRRASVALEYEIVAGGVVIIDAVDLAIAAGVRPPAGPAVAPAPGRRARPARAHPGGPPALRRVEEDAQRPHARLLGHEGGQPSLEHGVAARRTHPHLLVQRAVDVVIGLGPADVLLERQTLRLGLPAEDVAGVHVLET